MAEKLIIIFLIFSVYSLAFPWESKLIDILIIDGLHVELTVTPQIAIGIFRDYNWFCLSFPYFDIDVNYGKGVTKNGPRG